MKMSNLNWNDKIILFRINKIKWNLKKLDQQTSIGIETMCDRPDIQQLQPLVKIKTNQMDKHFFYKVYLYNIVFTYLFFNYYFIIIII